MLRDETIYSLVLRISVHFEHISSAIRLLQQLNSISFLLSADISPQVLADNHFIIHCCCCSNGIEILSTQLTVQKSELGLAST